MTMFIACQTCTPQDRRILHRPGVHVRVNVLVRLRVTGLVGLGLFHLCLNR